MNKLLEIRPGRLAGNLSTGPRLPVQKLVRPASRKSCGGELKKLRRTCWRIRMKRQPASYAEPSDSSFPLFSQKGAGDSALQVQAGKRVVVVSTDSQISSQQQGFIYLAFDRTSCSRDLWLCKFERSGLDSYRSGHALIPMLLIRLALTPTSCAVTEPRSVGGAISHRLKPTRSS